MENPDMKATHLGADRRKRCHLPFHPMWHTGQWRSTESERSGAGFQSVLDVHPSGGAGNIAIYENLGEAIGGAWMVIEAVPEDLSLKREVFRQLDRLSDPDAIVASNSSSLPTTHMLDDVEHRWRVLNTHYQQPPELNAGGVDVMR